MTDSFEDTATRVEQALVDLRTGFADDGADLRVSAWPTPTSVEVSLVLGPDACLDCIVPKNLLEPMVSGTIRAAVPEIDTVTINDPREAAV